MLRKESTGFLAARGSLFGGLVISPEMSGRTENNDTVAFDEKGLSSFRVPPKPIFALADLESSEASQFHGFPRENRLGNLLDHKVQSFTNRLPGKTRSTAMIACILDYICTIQGKPPYFG